MTRWRRTVAALLMFAGFALAELAAPVQSVATAPARSVDAAAVLSVAPSRGVSGSLVTITEHLSQTPTTCTLEQDGAIQRTYPCGPDTAIQFTVTGRPGQHTLTVCAPACATVDAVPTATAAFTVLSVVPSLIGLTESELPKALAAAGLRLGTVTGPVGSPVASQSPPGGSVVDPDSSVDVGLGVVATTSSAVVVPDLHGMPVARARAVVRSVGLNLVASTSDGYVQSQDPPARTTVAAGADVTVTVRARVTVRFVAVPDVRGDSVAVARQRLAGEGLLMASRATTGTVATQDLPPGRRVAAGTTVTVTVALITTPASSTTTPKAGWFWALAAAGVLLALAGGFIAHRLRRRRPASRPTAAPPPRVTCRSTVDTVHVTATGPLAPTVDLRVRQHATLTMERKP